MEISRKINEKDITGGDFFTHELLKSKFVVVDLEKKERRLKDGEKGQVTTK